MARRRATRVGVLAAATLALTSLAIAPAAYAVGHDHGRKNTFAVIGDIPSARTRSPRSPRTSHRSTRTRWCPWSSTWATSRTVLSECTDAYFSMIPEGLRPVPGPARRHHRDNEWTDCHRPDNGAFNPLARLDAVRSTFFDRPGLTLGQRPVRVSSDVAAGFPENVSWTRDHVAFTSCTSWAATQPRAVDRQHDGHPGADRRSRRSDRRPHRQDPSDLRPGEGPPGPRRRAHRPGRQVRPDRAGPAARRLLRLQAHRGRHRPGVRVVRTSGVPVQRRQPHPQRRSAAGGGVVLAELLRRRPGGAEPDPGDRRRARPTPRTTCGSPSPRAGPSP